MKQAPYEVSDVLRRSEKQLSLDAPLKNDDKNNLMDVIPDNLQASPDDVLIDESLRFEIKRALTMLSAREAEVIELYFGLGRERPHTLEEIGDKFNVSREMVRQIKKKAMQRLRHSTRSRGLSQFRE